MISNSPAGNPEKSWQERNVAAMAVVRNGVRWVGTPRAETFLFPTSRKNRQEHHETHEKHEMNIRGQTNRRHHSSHAGACAGLPITSPCEVRVFRGSIPTASLQLVF